MSASLSIPRLPSPPKDYRVDYMARLINTLELEKRASFLASSFATKTAQDDSEAVSWFLG